MDKEHLRLVNFKFFRTKVFFISVILILLVVGLLLRLGDLNEVPLGFSCDEASLGYNAWAVLKTGRDEWGEFLPLHFWAFGEWKLPVYIYVDIPFVALLGLNEMAVRLPSILAGLCSSIIFGLIWRQLKGAKVGVIGGLLFLFSFWSFSLSRAAYEVNLGLFLFLLGIYFLVLKKPILAVFPFVFSLYTYNAFRLFLPLFLIILLFVFRKEVVKKKMLIIVFLFLLGIAPLVRFFLISETAFSRLNQVIPESNRIQVFASNYLSHFNPNFWLVKGDSNLRHFPGKTGQFSYLVVLLGFVGLLSLCRRSKKQNKVSLLVLATLALAPIPAAITKESPHSLRAIMLLPAWLSLACLGVDHLSRLMKRTEVKVKWLLLVTILALMGQYVYFYYDYYKEYPYRSAEAWQLGYKELFVKLESIGPSIPVYVSTTKIQPYIFKLFYYPEVISQANYDTAHPEFWHQSRISRIDNFHFVDSKTIAEMIENKEEGTYVVDSTEKDFIPEDREYSTVLGNNKPSFYMFKI